MHDVTYSMSTSLDGYIIGPDGRFDWSVPDPEVFRLATDEVRAASVHLRGRHLYETMLFWEGGEQNPDLDEAEREFAAIWNALPKIVFSSTLTDVRGNARLAEDTLAEEIQRLRSEPGEGDLAVGGARLAAAAAEHDLIDEYRVRVYPVLVGGGVPFFARLARQVDLDLLESRTIGAVQYVRYRVRR